MEAKKEARPGLVVPLPKFLSPLANLSVRAWRNICIPSLWVVAVMELHRLTLHAVHVRLPVLAVGDLLEAAHPGCCVEDGGPHGHLVAGNLPRLPHGARTGSGGAHKVSHRSLFASLPNRRGRQSSPISTQPENSLPGSIANTIAATQAPVLASPPILSSGSRLPQRDGLGAPRVTRLPPLHPRCPKVLPGWARLHTDFQQVTPFAKPRGLHVSPHQLAFIANQRISPLPPCTSTSPTTTCVLPCTVRRYPPYDDGLAVRRWCRPSGP
jgi:hypothetical protein